MAGARQPTALVIAKGKKHLTKAEIQERLASEVLPVTDNITAPDYLTKKQQAEFYKYAEQLEKLSILGETDVDALARYVLSLELYVKLTKKLNTAIAQGESMLIDECFKAQEKAFKQCRASALDLGLTISSRCKLVVPQVQEEKKESKFSRFKKGVVS